MSFCHQVIILIFSSGGRFCLFYFEPVSTRDNRVLKGPLGRSLRSFARSTHSAHSLRSGTLASLARSIQGLAHSLRGTVEIHVFMLITHFMGTNAIVVITGNTPSIVSSFSSKCQFLLSCFPVFSLFFITFFPFLLWHCFNHRLGYIKQHIAEK